VGTDEQVKAMEPWEFVLGARVVCFALSSGSGHAVVAGEDGKAYLLDRQGAVEGTFALMGDVVDVGASAEGSVFAAAHGRGEVTAFTRHGRPLWEVSLGRAPAGLHVGLAGRRVAVASPPYGVVLVGPGLQQSELKCRHEVASVALVEGQREGLVAAGNLGEVSWLDGDGTTRWRYNLGCRSGRVRVSASAGIIALPVHEDGVHAFTLEGEGAGAFDVGQDVSAASAASAPGGPVLAALCDESNVLLMDLEGNVLWDMRLEAAASDFAMTDDASLLVICMGGTKLLGFPLEVRLAPHAPGATHPGPAPSPEAEPDIALQSTQTARGLAPETAKGPPATAEKPPAPGTPRPGRAVLLARKQFPEGALGRGADRLAVTPDGRHVLVALADGTLLAFDRAGEQVAQARMEPGARVKRKRSNAALAAWDGRALTAVEFESGRTWQVPLGPARARHLDCTSGLELVGLVNEKDELALLRSDGTELRRTPLMPPAVCLLMSPTDGAVLVKDVEGRLRFFDSSGRLRRKQRIAGQERFEHIVLEDGFCALGGSQGRVLIQDARGKVLWTARVVERVASLESLGNAIGVYDASGKCLLLNPYGDILVEFDPPPGLCAMRIPRGGEPVLIHARRNVLTAFGGYHRKLEALWRFECEGEVELFEADRDASFAVIAAGGSLWFVQAPSG